MKMARGCWQSFPYYGGPCPDTDGCYGWRPNDDDNDCDCGGNERRRCRRRRRCWDNPCCGIFLSWLPVAISPNGIVPLAMNNPCRDAGFEVNSGLITVKDAGIYLATYTVRVPETAALDTTITMNVNDASQSPAITRVLTEAGQTTTAYTAQAIFEADEGDTVTLRSSEAINVTDTSTQPLFTLSLVKLDQDQ